MQWDMYWPLRLNNKLDSQDPFGSVRSWVKCDQISKLQDKENLVIMFTAYIALQGLYQRS